MRIGELEIGRLERKFRQGLSLEQQFVLCGIRKLAKARLDKAYVYLLFRFFTFIFYSVSLCVNSKFNIE